MIEFGLRDYFRGCMVPPKWREREGGSVEHEEIEVGG
jgi:hypothetical protein